MKIDIGELTTRFSYHMPKPGQADLYEKIRFETGDLADYLNKVCPDSRELSLAITHLEQAYMWAIAAIARRS